MLSDGKQAGDLGETIFGGVIRQLTWHAENVALVGIGDDRRRHGAGGPHHVESVVLGLPGEGFKPLWILLPTVSFHAGELTKVRKVWPENPLVEIHSTSIQ